MAADDRYLTPQQAEALALTLMRQHGVTAKGWQFAWSRGKQRLGETSISKRRDRKTGKVTKIKAIRLSRYLIERNPEPVVRDVILHEIAHALAGLEHGHDDVWKAMCKKVGAKPQRLADESVEIVQGPCALICTSCNRELARRHRRTAPEKLAKSYCRDCGPKALGKLKVVEAEA